MPIYDFKCQRCEHIERDVFERMSTAAIQCPKCQVVDAMIRIPVLPHTDLHAYHTPIEMQSIAMEDQAEIRRFKMKCPDVQISDDPRDENYGIPIAPNRKAKLQALKAAGYQEINSERVRR